MHLSEEDFIETQEGNKLYNESLDLHKKIERENAHVADVNGISMGYLEFGSNNDVPLIWAHGSGFTGYEILNVQAGLVAEGYRVIAIDYRGHGKTQIDVNDDNTSVYHIADDIAALMDHLKIARAAIGGLSKGGWIATAFYDVYPKRVLGLLLEDGGSWSHLQLKEDVQLKVVCPGPVPYPAEALKNLYDPSISYPTHIEALKSVLAAYGPAIKNNSSVEYITMLQSFLHQKMDGTWIYHCDGLRHFFGDVDPERDIEDVCMGATLYSRLPLMQQSQELMIPIVVYRNLDVPMHIIDPDSPIDWLPVRHQNEALQALHPDFIVHEVYAYEFSPHEAHFERPDRFIKSAKALIERVKLHSGLNKQIEYQR